MITGPETKYDAGDRSSLDTGVMYRFGGSTKTNYTNKIYTYVNSTQKQMTNSPKIMVGSTLTNIKGIWVGSKEVFGSKVVTDGGKLVNYMYYINGSWKSSQVTESVAAAKSYVSYSGNVQYGVYVGSGSENRPNIYFKGKILKAVDVSNGSSGWQYVYNNYIVAIFNPYTIYIVTG